MQTTESAWQDFVRHHFEDGLPPSVLEMMRLAFCVGRVSGLGAIREAAKSERWPHAWERLTLEAAHAAAEQGGRVDELASHYEAEIARLN